MRIAVTTPSGHVGGAVADCLLKAGVEVRLLARRPEKLKRFVDRGADIVRGSLDDRDYLIWTTHETDALLWVTPPGYGSDDLRVYQNRLGKTAAEAIRVNRILRVVNLSSLGADLSSGVGPINGLHDVEEVLKEAAVNITHLRPGYFFENFLWSLETIKSDGAVFLPVSGSTRYPMIACRDIARVAADRLTDSRWTGHWVQELHGPADLSFDEAAAYLSEAMKRKIVHIMITPEQARKRMLDTGMSESSSELMLELYDAIEKGRIKCTQPRSPETTTPTPLVAFAREVIEPLLHEPAVH